MPLLLNPRHLERENVILRGELPAAELDLEGMDELIKTSLPLRYDLVAQKQGCGILLQGGLHLTLRCECARCLKAFEHRLNLLPWTCLLPLEGSEKVIICDDCVDLTPHLREDIVLAFPQHPLCEPGCRGLLAAKSGAKQPRGASAAGKPSSAWAELSKLKL